MIDRFYCDNLDNREIVLDGDELNHLIKAVRKRVGESVELIDGKGAIATAKITKIERRAAHLEIISKETHTKKGPFVRLVQGVCRPNRLEMIIEKGTELGVDEFILVPMERSEKRPAQLERLRRITIGAIKQCGRLHLPQLTERPHIEDLPVSPTTLYGALSPECPPFLDAYKGGDITVIIGPESGFSESELVFLEEKAQGATLGPNVLRCETAAIAALSLIHHELIN